MLTRFVQGSVALAIVAFWLHSMYGAWQLEREVTPRDVRVGRAPYEVLLMRALERDPFQYLGIYQGAKRIGHSATEIRRLDRDTFLVENVTFVTPDLLIPIPARVRSQVRIGRDFLMEGFTADLHMVGQRMRFTGQAAGNEMVVTIPSSGGGAPRMIRVAREATLFNGLSPFVGIPELRVGEEWYIQGIDVTALAEGPDAGALRSKLLTVRVDRQEAFAWNGQVIDAFVASIAEEPNDPLKRRSRAWIAPDGRVLAEEHRFLDWAFTFKREEPPAPGAWERAR